MPGPGRKVLEARAPLLGGASSRGGGRDRLHASRAPAPPIHSLSTAPEPRSAMTPSPPSSFRRPSSGRHRLVLGGVAVPVALIGSMLGAPAADAATFPVTTKADLVSRMNAAVN